MKYFIFSTFLLFTASFSPEYIFAARPANSSVRITVNIPDVGSVSVLGYAGANDKIVAESTRVYGETFSDEKGYFKFSNLSLAEGTKEVCLTAIDHQNRESFPVCVPIPSNLGGEIGPVLLSPTLSLVNDSKTGLIYAEGQTIPGAVTKLTISKEETFFSGFLSRLNYKTYAASSLNNTIKPDQYGTFSYQLASLGTGKFRIFTTAKLDNSPTPKSRTLTFSFFNAYLLTFIVFLIWLIAALLTDLITRTAAPENQSLHPAV